MTATYQIVNVVMENSPSTLSRVRPPIIHMLSIARFSLMASFFAVLAGAGGCQTAPAGGRATSLSDHELIQSKQVDELFADYTRSMQPGCGVAVVSDGRTVHEAAYGYADLDYRIPLTVDSKFRVASVSKQFTAAALATAEQDGLLSLDDSIGRYLPTLQARTRQIPLRYFVSHSAGIKGFEQSLAGIATGVDGKPVNFGSDDYLSADELFELSRKVAPESDPGGRLRTGDKA